MTPSFSSPTSRTHALTAAAAVLALAGCSSQGAAQSEPASSTSPQTRILFQGNDPDHTLGGAANLDGSDVT